MKSFTQAAPELRAEKRGCKSQPERPRKCAAENRARAHAGKLAARLAAQVLRGHETGDGFRRHCGRRLPNESGWQLPGPFSTTSAAMPPEVQRLEEAPFEMETPGF